MTVSEETYEQVALEDREGCWELVRGRLRRKPGMTVEHNQSIRSLAALFMRQLPEGEFAVTGLGRLRAPDGSFFVPDLYVLPQLYIRKALAERRHRLEAYIEPMPLVVEAWSPRTEDYDEDYDIEEKLVAYRQRGDAEVWRIHPYERTVTAWRRQVDGSYIETVYSGGVAPVASLPGVQINLQELFE